MSTTTRSREPARWPTRDQWTDLAFLLVLLGVALTSWASTFTGITFWWVSLLGAVLATGCVVLVRAARLPAAVSVVAAIAVFVAVGGPLCLRSQGDTALLPWVSAGPLVDQVLYGWKDLLTTLPPVDGSGPLLVLPWTMGTVAGLVGSLVVLARWRTSWWGGLLSAGVVWLVLAVVVLLGVARPHSLALQGSVLAALTLAWLVVAGQRDGAVVRNRGWSPVRGAGALGMLLVATGVALPLTSVIAGEPDRVVARDYVDPPFEIGRYPSPLAAFRNYVDLRGREEDTNVHDSELFRVSGLEDGDRIRMATLDHWDGLVFGATDDALGARGAQDAFQRVSSRIDNPAQGREVRVQVSLGEGYRGVWLPTAGALQALDFRRGDVQAKEDSFRYNLATSTAVVPSGLHPGDSYSFEAVLPEDDLTPEMTPSSDYGVSHAPTEFLDRKVEEWSATADTPMERLFAVAERLRRDGRYSDGVRRAERSYLPGHGLRRLSAGFVNAPTMVGNDEQYAAVMTLLADRVGVPARVVLGATVPANGVVRGQDVSAWVEVRVADGSWRTLPTEAFMSQRPPSEQQPQTQEPMTGTVVPPPAPIPPPSDVGDPSDSELRTEMDGEDEPEDEDEQEDGGGGLPGWLTALLLYAGLPLLILALLVAAVLGAKALRRWRRRTAPTGHARVVGAWRELIDHARDLGRPVPAGPAVTRREQSRELGSVAAPVLARTADGHVFGPVAATEEDAASFWDSVLAERRELSGQTDRWRRVRAALSLASFAPAGSARSRDWRLPRRSG